MRGPGPESAGGAGIRAGQQEEPLTSDSHHIVWRNRGKKLSMPEVQGLFGFAVAYDKQPDRLNELGATPRALDFADRAKALVFAWTPATGELFGESPRAAKLLSPGLRGFERRWGCSWPETRQCTGASVRHGRLPPAGSWPHQSLGTAGESGASLLFSDGLHCAGKARPLG